MPGKESFCANKNKGADRKNTRTRTLFFIQIWLINAAKNKTGNEGKIKAEY